ncbi:hypothetical protein GLOIN_2v1482460 [Rhizophagus clarus]|uniref:Uncharacterized protein n=2 Tax=Rhizophagus clarus TaxID=94130 RepID=A0A8H3QQU6_9GLOM|nr:hypothetical protein GLOIN_2v1482460 [Rhizophagus clarus]
MLERLLDIQRTNETNIKYNQNFDTEIIKKEILAEFEYDCKDSSSHVVILEPADSSNSDQVILEAANMYRADFNLQENEYLDIIANKAIFRYYELLNLAKKLGVQFLDKFEAAVDYQIISRVIDLLWLVVEVARIWKLHQIGMRIENHNLQQDALFAASPLFSSTSKSNYVVAIAQHLFTLTKYPSLNEILQYVRTFRISKNTDNKNKDQKSVYFSFDEALEMFSVYFIKQNIIENVIDEVKLKVSIKAIQSKSDRINLLLNEYLDDISIFQSEHLEPLKLHKKGLNLELHKEDMLWKFREQGTKTIPRKKKLGGRQDEDYNDKILTYMYDEILQQLETE